MEGPKTVVLNRRNGAFGFTLRHFIVYPPDATDPVIAEKLARCGLSNFSQPMDTVFVKKVTHKSEAEYAGLKEGDRIIAVNGIPISFQFQFPDIVATIQNTSKTLIIQIVPKCYDILQTFFSETAHNPETNQRPLQNNNTKATNAIPVSVRTTAACQRTELCNYPANNNNINNMENSIYQIPVKNEEPCYSNGEGAMKMIPVFNQQQKPKLFTSTPINQNQEIKDAIMSRLKHQIEQKEEFLRRPNGISPNFKPSTSSSLLSPPSLNIQRLNPEHENFTLESEFARSLNSTIHHSTIQELKEIQSNRSALREQFFTNHNSSPLQSMDNFRSSPNSSYHQHCEFESHQHVMSGSEKELQLKNSRGGLQIVLERTKQFETGHPLPPDGIDRTLLYKSELSRMSTKPSTSSVASRCQAIESRIKPKISSKCLSEEIMKEDEIRSDDDMTRSVSMEPIKECDKSVDKSLSLLEKEKERPRPVRENSYLTAVRSSTDNQSFLRQKSPKKVFSKSEEMDRKTRRSSYLKATTNDGDDLNNQHNKIAQKNNKENDDNTTSTTNTKLSTFRGDSNSQEEREVVTSIREGLLNVKIISINGRRTQDRSWRLCNAELKKNFLKLSTVRENKNSQSPDSEGTLDLTNFVVSEGGSYSKRKHVFRLSSVQCDGHSSNESELMLQSSNPQEMKDWVTSFKTVTRDKKEYSGESSSELTLEKLDSSSSVNEESLNSSFPQKSMKKYHFGSRSPSGQSPVFKSRKAPQNLLVPTNSSSISREGSDKETNSPKQKSWKSFVTNQFKKMQPQNESSSTNESSVCFLADCTPSEEDIHVPLLVAKCTKIVETKGLGIVGIYRIPGNTAAISGLFETIKLHGFNEQTLNDAKWDDVNVVSSLLKLFIRSLTEPILPNNLYQCFISADKITNEEQRFQELRNLLRKFPPHNYGTLKHLIGHLSTVSSNSSVNLMEPRNLAIVFGPSIIRKCNDSLETVVKDMRHQCQIVESLINNYGYFFENETTFKHKAKNVKSSNEPELPSADHLLENVSKIESLTREYSKDSSSRFVANIVQAANRKIRKTTQRRSTTSSCTSDTDSVSNSEHKTVNKFTKSMKNNETSRSSDSQDDSDGKFNAKDKETSEGLSLSATVTEMLDSKIRSLRNSFELGTGDENQPTQDSQDSSENSSSPIKPTLNTHKPLSLGENIPYVDESPERPLIQARMKPMRHCHYSDAKLDKKLDYSSDTDSSTTSNPHQRLSVIRLEDSVLRKVNRILTNLEHLERKYSLNRSLSLNYKSHKGECCCSSRLERNRLTLTKDEKTDKNISKRKQLYDTTNIVNSQSSNGNTKYRKHHNGNRSIRRRHTVGGEINREEIKIIKR